MNASRTLLHRAVRQTNGCRPRTRHDGDEGKAVRRRGRRRLCCLSHCGFRVTQSSAIACSKLSLAQHVAAILVRARSAVAVAAAAQNAAGDDSASRRAHAVAHPLVRNQYACTSNKGPRREPFERLRWRVRDMVEITPQQPRSQRKFGDWSRSQ